MSTLTDRRDEESSSNSNVTGWRTESFESRSDDEIIEQEKLLEELLRLKLTSSPPSAVAAAASTSLSTPVLPPKQRIKLFQPRTKFEQFEDILLESQLLDSSLANTSSPFGLMDFEASDSIFSDSSSSSGGGGSGCTDPCKCTNCTQRLALAQEQKEEVERLREVWLLLRQEFWTLYRLVIDGAWNDSNRTKPELGDMKDKVQTLCWRDPHQLFQRLEAGAKEFVIDKKVKLLELLQKEAKNPNLAQIFIQSLLQGYEKLVSAAIHLSPALIDLETVHLNRFSLTWEIHNKHLYQAIIYADPLIQNNLPIFISQLRSLYPDKEHEARYTELVRGYLDFDVEMENIDVFWKTSESLIQDYNQKRIDYRRKQKMFKKDWEKFKVIRQDGEEIKLGKDDDEDKNKTDTNNDDDEYTQENEDENDEKYRVKESKEARETKELSSENCECHACNSSTSSTSTSFIDNFSASALPSEIPSSLLLSSSSSTQTQRLCTNISSSSSSIVSSNTSPYNLYPHIHGSPPISLLSNGYETLKSDHKEISEPRVYKNKSSNTSVPNNKDINKLLQAHYCSHKKPPSANAVRKGKVPPPPEDDDEECEDEYTEDSGSHEDTCSSSSDSKHYPDSKHCSCCYCEVFGHGGPSVAPVSRNYPEMRERLLLLLNKKKKCKQQQQQQQQQQVQLQQQVTVQQKHPQQVIDQQQQQQHHHHHHHHQNHHVHHQQGTVQQTQQHHVTAQQHQRKIVSSVASSLPSSSSSCSLPTQNSVSSYVGVKTLGPTTKDVDQLLDYIEGNVVRGTNEKKRAKKDRQRQAKLQELRVKEEEENRIRLAEEAEQQRREEEERAAQEFAHQLLKKRNKKAAQRAKKAAAKGLPPPPSPPLDSALTAARRLEALKAQHAREVQQLKYIQMQQLEETQRNLLRCQAQQQQQQQQIHHQISLGSKGKSLASSSSSSSSLLPSSSSGPGKQIRITRTPSGGVEFSSVPECGSNGDGNNNNNNNGGNSRSNSVLLPQQQQQHTTTTTTTNHSSSSSRKYSPPSNSRLKKMGAYAAKGASSSPPMVTIKRVHNGNSSDPTVTISTKENSSSSSKLLYTLINGQIHKSKHAPVSLLPSSKPSELKKKVEGGEGLSSSSSSSSSNLSNLAKRKNLPTTPEGKLDLENLNLPPGISITRIEGPIPERKYYPCNDLIEQEEEEQELNLYKSSHLESSNVLLTSSSSLGAFVDQVPVDYSAMAGMPPGLNGPNVIVVDTSSLSGKDEGKKMQGSTSNSTTTSTTSKNKNKKNKNKNNSNSNHSSSSSSNTTTTTTNKNVNSAQLNANNSQSSYKDSKSSSPPPSSPSVSFSNYFSSALGESSSSSSNTTNSNNNLNSGPQVLIKNVNGKVVITPVPGTGATLHSFDKGTTTLHKKGKKAKENNNNSNNNTNGTIVTAACNTNTTAAANTQDKTNLPRLSSTSRKNASSTSTTNTNKTNNNNNANEIVVSVNGVIDDVKKSKKKLGAGDNIDEITSIFAPKDIDLENGEMDDDEREIEAFKRFCFNSVPRQQKTKVNFDVKNIAFKKK